MREAVCEKQFCDSDAGTSSSVYYDTAVFFLLPCDFQGVDDACQDDDRCSMLVIVEYRDGKQFF